MMQKLNLLEARVRELAERHAELGRAHADLNKELERAEGRSRQLQKERDALETAAAGDAPEAARILAEDLRALAADLRTL